MTESGSIRITPVKGRPMLTWVGKRPLSRVTAFPAQHVETFDPIGDATWRADERDLWSDWPDRYPRGGLLFHGDNKEVLAHLLANGFRGKVKLIYIDPPFDSGADYVRRVRLRGATGTTQIDGEGYTLGEQIQYEDIWANDNYLQFIYERLLLLKELLSDEGVIAIHLDWRRSHSVRLLLDEVFAPGNFVNHIIWHYYGFKRSTSTHFPRKHDDILVYAKSGDYTWHMQYRPHSDSYLKRWKIDEHGRLYRDDVNPTGGGARVIYLDEVEGDIVDSVWDDIPPVNPVALERMDFPTQKPEALVKRLVAAFTDPSDLVLDCFVGSGTTAAVAQKLGRRWIGCDINKGAIQTTSKRLQTIIKEQIEARKKNGQTKLLDSEDAPPEPAQLSFTVWRVNDYDLQIQHNEAVNLACEHIGIQRTRTDSFFDGTLGSNLVKIIPFNHPLTPLDLDEIRRELETRPEEDRNITVVCLGKELSADAWIEDWNRLRRGAGAVNRIEVIELRTDARYGKFFIHKPASAKVKVSRENGRLLVEIQDFVSPTIIERLSQQSGVLTPMIEDWRAMVDCVMIDPAYDGKVFNIALSDIPEKKDDLVSGTYTLPAPDSETTVAVKIIDMLGEEVLELHRV